MSNEVEVKPYGTKNEAETRATGTVPLAKFEVSAKPPYGQKNESTSAPQPSSFNIGGSRSDVEVKPFGAQEVHRETLSKPQRAATATARPLEQWRNPLMATLLGITLALTLLSLSYLPRAISGAWHWTASWTPWGRSERSEPLQKAYEAYDSVTKRYPQERDAMFEQGREMYRDAKEQGREMYRDAKEQGREMYRDAKEQGDSLFDRVKHTGEDLYERARDSIYAGPSLTEEARIGACRTAQKARDAACEGVNTRTWGLDESMRGARDMARDTARDARDMAEDASDRAAGVFETAKQKAADVLESAKETITYPLHAAEHAGENLRETVMSTGQQARERADETARAARDGLRYTEGYAQATKESVQDTVRDSAAGAKDSVLSAGQKVRETVVGAGQAAANMASNAAHRAKDTVLGSHEDVASAGQRGPTKVKVEVQEL